MSQNIIIFISLSVAFAGLLFSFLILEEQHAVDDFHENKEDIYYILRQEETSNGKTFLSSEIDTVSLAAIEFFLPDKNRKIVKIATKEMMLRGAGPAESRTVHFVNNAFFDVFTFPLETERSFAYNRQDFPVQISRQTALELFGYDEPLGQTLYLSTPDRSRPVPLTIVGILKDVPKNSSINPQILVPFSLAEDYLWFNTLDVVPGLYLESYAYLPDFSSKLLLRAFLDGRSDLVNPAYEERSRVSYVVKPFDQSRILNKINRYDKPLPDSLILFFGVLIVCSLLLLLLAILSYNFIALSNLGSQFKEVQIRRAHGATSYQIALQEFSGPFALCGTAILFGIIILEWSLPAFNHLFKGILQIHARWEPGFIYLIPLWIVISLFMGALPSSQVVAFRPVRNYPYNLSRGLGKGRSFLLIQIGFTFCIGLAAFLGIENLNRIISLDIGINTDNVYVIDVSSDPLDKEYPRFRDILRDMEEVLFVSGSDHVFWNESDSVWTLFDSLQRRVLEGVIIHVEEPFFDLYQIPFIQKQQSAAGNGITIPDKTGQIIVITEQTAEMINPRNHIKKHIYYRSPDSSGSGEISGVVEDIQVQHPLYPPVPVVIKSYNTNFDSIRNWPYISIRFSEPVKDAGARKIETLWKRLYPGRPFRGFWLNEQMENSVKDSIKPVQFLLSIMALTAFGGTILSTYVLGFQEIQQQRRRLGLYKVFGMEDAHQKKYLFMRGVRLLFSSSVISGLLAFIIMYVLGEITGFSFSIIPMPRVIILYLFFCFALVFLPYRVALKLSKSREILELIK